MTADAVEQVTGVVLAGGESSRFGEPNKAVARIDGTPMIRRVIERIRSAELDPPIVAVRSRSQCDRIRDVLGATTDVRFVYDVDRFTGPLAGVVAASHATSAPWIFVTACDMPVLDDRAISGICESRGSAVDAVVPVGADGRPEPLHACYRCSTIDEYWRTARTDTSFRALLAALNSVLEVNFEPGSILAESTVNVNTRSEFHQLSGQTEVTGDD